MIGLRLSALFSVQILTVACQANTPLPKGFNQACYGNGRLKSGTTPIYYAELNIQSASLPQLNAMLRKFAEKNSLKLYDDSPLVKRAFDDPDGFTMYLCSQAGLFASVDDRVWLSLPDSPSGSSPEVPTSPVLSIAVTTYLNDEQWRSFSKELDSTLRSKWPNQLREVDPRTWDHSYLFPATNRDSK